MVKFLKFVLFIIIIAFAFALGVKFSDSFKGNIITQREEQIKIETEMNRAFEGSNVDTSVPSQNGYVDTTPVQEIESDFINDATQQPAIEYIDIEVIEPMDNIPNTILPDATPQVTPSAPTPAAPVPVTPTAPGTPVPAAPAVVPVTPTAPTPVQNNAPARVQPATNAQPVRR